MMIKNLTHSRHLLFLFCLICFVGCEKDIEFSYKTAALTTNDFSVCDVQDCPKIELTYPVFSQPQQLSASINRWIREQIDLSVNAQDATSASIEDALLQHINRSQTGYPETSEFSEEHEFTAEVAISYLSNKVVSIVYDYYVFDGGAHGYHKSYYANFNPRTGETYDNRTVLKGDFYAFAKAKFQQKYPNTTFEIDPKTFSDQELYQLGFSEEGVVILYSDEYSIPIQDDGYRIIIPWSEVEDYLIPDMM